MAHINTSDGKSKEVWEAYNRVIEKLREAFLSHDPVVEFFTKSAQGNKGEPTTLYVDKIVRVSP